MMGAILPTLQAEHLREGLTDYLATTFALTDPDAQAALTDFISNPDTGMFKGPYVRLRLPFASAGDSWQDQLDWWPEDFTPYGHQAAAFDQLSTKYQGRPQPTLVTTGTGSGKTEAFLIPILDHVLRAKKAGITGMKALILYPMNALANDQEQRLAKLITGDPRLAPVAAGLYTGEHGSGGRTRVSEHGLITDRALMHDAPPDILLTNYKMLDHLLLHPGRADMWRHSADSLQYLVLDEFHSYDGAQGTDVAMLLRRLGLTLKAHWTAASKVSEADRHRALGKITPVATSATLGSGSAPTAMVAFAATVFGGPFGHDAVIGETRLSVDKWLSARTDARDNEFAPIDPVLPEALDRIEQAREVTGNNAAIAAVVFATLFDGDTATLDATVLLDQIKRHPLIHDVLSHAVDTTSIADLAGRVFPPVPVGRDAARTQATRTQYLHYLLALLSHVRAETGRAALGVEVHLWIRELSRVDRAVRATTHYRWSDDGAVADETELYLPAVFCRHCGRSGWGARLAPTGNALDVTDEAIRADHAAGAARFRALISAPAEAHVADPVEGLCWFHLDHRELLTAAPDPDDPDLVNGRVLPVLTLIGPDADDQSTKDVCPACGAADGIRFLGSAVATQLSVTLSNLFGDKNLAVAEKKALMFTDSVQDAAHRAGFVQARSHSLSLRTALRGALGDAELNLAELSQAVIARAGTDPLLRYQLVPPDVVDHDAFVGFWKAGVHPNTRRAAENRAKRRLQFDIDLEFGLQSRTGRTLELTGSVAAEVYLGGPHRAAIIGRRAVDSVTAQIPLTGLDEATLARWVRGTVERIRTQGGIHHEWLRRYVEKNASRYHIWGGRPRGQGMPAFPKGRPAPAFPAHRTGNTVLPEGFDPITPTTSWYAKWASQCLDVSAHDGAFLAKALFAELTADMVLNTITTETGATVYGLPAATIMVSAPSSDALHTAQHLLSCDVCQTPVPGSATTVEELDGAPCLLVRCPGKLRRTAKADNFYRRLYNAGEMKRVVAREHTSLLPTKVRLAYETAFKAGGTDPQAPNVLVATPTLEMGIDIGDLSTVMLGSLPRSVASYLQRVGRAGRLTGNSLALAYVRGRGEHLPKLFEPLSVIQGEVRPPATLLNAEEILQRQYVAHIIDRLARDPNTAVPKDARAVFGDPGYDGWLAGLLDLAATQADALLGEFLAQFGEQLSEDAATGLRAWASPPPEGGTSRLTQHLTAAAYQWRVDLDELTNRLTAVEAELPEFERRAASPAATDDDRRALRIAKGSRKLLSKQITSITTDYWIAVLERYGVLPNYTLLDDSVTLDVGVTWVDPDSGDYLGDSLSYQRGSRVALTELAPGATFYAQGLAVTIDAVDLGTGESNIQSWQLCPQCGWAGISASHVAAQPVSSCPRCHNTAISDVSQHLPVVEMTRVSAEVRRDEATINDNRDDRMRQPFTVVTAADVDPAQVGHTWFRPDAEFGAQYLRRIDIRWLNLGKRTSQGKQRTMAGQESANGLFRVCGSCGQLDTLAGRNTRYEHRPWCRLRDSATEDVREIALARTLRTQAVLLHLPPQLEYDSFAHPSLAAAIMLGLRQVIGGSPEHLAVAAIPDALRAPERRALLLHDTVPGGTGYLAEFADHTKIWAVLAAARTVVAECSCQQEERLACHRCLLPFAPPHELDKAARATALKLLDDILGVVDGAVPELDTWAAGITETAPPPPPTSDESFLEREFYTVFVERLKLLGATVVEKPGVYGPSATITVQGSKARKWSLRPQVSLGFVQPDFELQTADPDVPKIAIFTDGRAYHAVAGCNRVADDADKREKLRASGYLVWSFGHDDLQRFKAGDTSDPVWFDQKAAHVVTSRFQVQPDLIRLLAKDPVTQLLEFLLDPDIDAWEKFSTRMPYLFVRTDNRANSDAESVGEAAIAALDGAAPFPHPGGDVCWVFADGGVAVTAGVHTAIEPPRAVLVFDDRDDRLEILDGKAWKIWLRLSNWLGICRRHRISTRSLLAAKPVELAVPVQEGLPGDWQTVYDEAVSDGERTLIRALAEAGAAVPILGYETDSGEVLDFAWNQARIGVVFDHRAELAGWTLCPPDAGEIIAALKTNGVM